MRLNAIITSCASSAAGSVTGTLDARGFLPWNNTCCNNQGLALVALHHKPGLSVTPSMAALVLPTLLVMMLMLLLPLPLPPLLLLLLLLLLTMIVVLQGTCGACVAFATSVLTEFVLMKRSASAALNSQPVGFYTSSSPATDLSESDLMECDRE